jgi:hypothetical protein
LCILDYQAWDKIVVAVSFWGMEDRFEGKRMAKGSSNYDATRRMVKLEMMMVKVKVMMMVGMKRGAMKSMDNRRSKPQIKPKCQESRSTYVTWSVGDHSPNDRWKPRVAVGALDTPQEHDSPISPCKL